MERGTDLDALEREAYQASWSDGIIDLYCGLALLWMGAAWIWLPGMAGLAGVIPAIFVAPMLAARKRFLEPRIGYVQWRGPRRERERRQLWIVLLVGVGLLLGGVGLVAFGASDGALRAGDLAPGLMAWLLSLLIAGIALVSGVWRLLAYAAVLVVAGMVVVAAQANPGWSMLAGGVVATVGGAMLLIRFVGRYPVVEHS